MRINEEYELNEERSPGLEKFQGNVQFPSLPRKLTEQYLGALNIVLVPMIYCASRKGLNLFGPPALSLK